MRSFLHSCSFQFSLRLLSLNLFHYFSSFFLFWTLSPFLTLFSRFFLSVLLSRKLVLSIVCFCPHLHFFLHSFSTLFVALTLSFFRSSFRTLFLNSLSYIHLFFYSPLLYFFSFIFESLQQLVFCSQRKFVAIMIGPVGLFHAIFPLTHLTFRPQKRDKQVEPSGHLSALRAFQITSLQVCDSQKLFWRLILMV